MHGADGQERITTLFWRPKKAQTRLFPDGSGGYQPPTKNNATQSWTNNGHSFMDDIGGDGTKVINYLFLGNKLNDGNRLVLRDNNNNIVDVVDYSRR